MASVEAIEEYLDAVEEYFFSSLSVVTNGLPNVHEAVNRLWVDISRYGPGMPAFPDVRVPNLGDFQVPPSPPPVPEPASSSCITRSLEWVGNHPWKASGLVFGVLGAGFLAGYHKTASTRVGRRYNHKSVSTSERKQVVVILGGDSPYALPLILDLEQKGFIVIASVATVEGVETLEHQCKGYVKALVLDPHEPESVPVFLRSLSSTLSRRFPITSAGDPYSLPSTLPYIHSVISLLTLSTTTQPIHAPFEHISLRDAYLPYLTATHITPLQTIQALLPLLRTVSARSRDKGKKTIIVCLPTIDARVGLPFASVQAMSAASTLRGIEILRREINIAAMTDKTESVKNIKVVVVDVGAFDIGTFSGAPSPESVYKSMEHWTASEKLTYGPAFASILQETSRPKTQWEVVKSSFKNRNRYGVPLRKPADLSIFVSNIVGVVSGGRFGPTLLGFEIGLGRVRNWIRGENFSVGAGAYTYRMASHLPSLLLDGLLTLPHFLVSIRNRLLPVQPFQLPTVDTPASLMPEVKPLDTGDPHYDDDKAESASMFETNSEPDTEGDDGGGSWVSLKKAPSENSVSV